MTKKLKLNPLQKSINFPPFRDINPNHILNDVIKNIKLSNKELREIEQTSSDINWENVIKPLESLSERLEKSWNLFSHLNSVINSPELRKAFQKAQPKITKFYSKLGQNLSIFEKINYIKNSSQFEKFNQTQKKIIDNLVKDFKLSGVMLSEDNKKKLISIEKKLKFLSSNFSENILDSINSYELIILDKKILKGIPNEEVKAAKNSANEIGKKGYRFTLHQPSYYPVLQHAENRNLRKKIYYANSVKASELCNEKKYDNSKNIINILKLRQKKSHILGYSNYAEFSLEKKMVDCPKQVIVFLEELALKAKSLAEKEITTLKEFSKKNLNLKTLQAWDIAYASEKLRENRFSFSEKEIKNYFPEKKVINGLFKFLEKMFDITISSSNTSIWHEDVKFYCIKKRNKILGHFYTDLYARQGKNGGAWMNDYQNRKKDVNGLQTPIAFIVCNFTKPEKFKTKSQKNFFSHDDIITIFHEFGHAIHHLLTTVDEVSVSGISGVEWDAVELPSQFLENFCWEFETLRSLSSHKDTGKKLPLSIYKKILSAKNFHAGLNTLRQIEFSLFDIYSHFKLNPSKKRCIEELKKEVQEKSSVFIKPCFDRFQNSFSHIFCGGYAAGYYSYKWAEVLSSDIYSTFKNAKNSETKTKKINKLFFKEILSVGGSRPTIESFISFKGRKPNSDAFFEHLRIENQNQ